MFGPSLLVAPVTKANVSKWNTYLPDYAAGWIDFWRGGKYQGGQSVDIDVDMEKYLCLLRLARLFHLVR